MSVKTRYVVAALGVGAIAVTLVLHRGSLLSPGDVLHALALANPWWLLLAAAAQFASLAAFGEQQRYLVKTFGGAMTLGRSIAVTFARTAISVTVPGGPAVSIAFAIRQFRARGATAGAATAVTVLAGLQGIGSLLLVYLAWFSTVGLIAGHLSGLGTAAAAAVLLLAAVLGLRLVRTRTDAGRRIRAFASRWRWTTAVVDVASGAIQHATSLSVRDWAVGGAAALANWLLDVACLVATAHAFGLTIGVVQIVGVYLAIQLVRQIPLTPGGVGVVEASLLVALVALGAPSGAAAAVVLIYRLLSSWLIAPVGLLAWIGLRPGQHRDGSGGATAADDRVEAGGEQQHRAGDDVFVTRRIGALDQVAHPVDDDRNDQAA